MCGRITQNLKLETLVAKYGVGKHPELDLTPHYNGCPGHDFAVVRTKRGERRLAELRWGRIPEWAEGKPGARRLINARSETVHEKASFRAAFRERRCIIPVNGWFERKPEASGKQPYWLRPEGAALFPLAGIWESGGTSPGSMDTFVILTTVAIPAIADIHHRQPLILNGEAMGAWLEPGRGHKELIAMARKGCDGTYERRAVSSDVNDPRNDHPERLLPSRSPAAAHEEKEFQLECH